MVLLKMSKREYYDFVKVTWIDGVCHTSRDKEKEKDFNRRVYQRVKKNGKNNPKLSMFRWMADSQFIDDEDYTILEKCYDRRNEYAHDIAGCLNRFVTKEEKGLLKSLIAISVKAAFLTALDDMKHEYETAYIKAALIRSHHLDPHISFSVFLRAICTFSGREYKHDPAQRVDTVIYHEEKRFLTSKSSKWQRGRRIVSYLTEVFRATPKQ